MPVPISMPSHDPFRRSTELFLSTVGMLGDITARTMTFSETEAAIGEKGRAIMRQLLEDFLALRESAPPLESVVGSDREIRTHRIPRTRTQMSTFGPVSWRRVGYGGHGFTTLFPGDAELNLPVDRYSHGVKKIIAHEAARSSFDDTLRTLGQMTGAHVPKRQIEEIAAEAAIDFDDFYAAREIASPVETSGTGPILAISADGKGIVMRHEDLRDETKKAAESASHLMETRLSPGEKRNRKRMATVATVFTVARHERTPEDVIRLFEPVHDVAKEPPRPENKRVFAHVAKEPEEVIAEAFAEAAKRDPERVKTWVVVVDGNPTQIRQIRERARRCRVKITVVLDLIHVIEYLWKAATALVLVPGPERERYVKERILEILRGRASSVAGGMRRAATVRGLSGTERAPIDACAKYLLGHKKYLRYHEYLAAGLPIASGVVEGACRHLVKDRMDVTGARWSLRGAEAILQLRSLRSSDDFDEYWSFHERCEWRRNHEPLYLAAPPSSAAEPFRVRHKHVVRKRAA